MDVTGNTIGDVVARDRRSDAPAIRRGDAPDRPYSYRRVCTDAWKAGNLLRYRGVRAGATVGVVTADGSSPQRSSPQPIIAFLGAALLGAPVRFDPPRDADVRALVAPADAVDAHDPPAGAARLAYGGSHDDPGVGRFEREVWSENPTMPPERIAADAPALLVGPPADRDAAADTDADADAGGRPWTQGELLTAAAGVADELGLTDDDEVAVRAPLALAGTVVAGVLAPLSVGATVLLPGSGEGDGNGNGDGDAPVGTVAVATTPDDAPEPGVVDPRDRP